MKILQINTVAGAGSIGRIASEIDDILQQNSVSSIIAFGRGIDKKGGNSFKFCSRIEIYLNVLETRIFDNHGFGTQYSTFRLISEIEKINPDIIHLHNIHGYYLNVDVLFSFLSKIRKPVVWTLHDCWSFTGHCTHFDYIKCERWKSGCYQCPQKMNYPSSLALDRSKKNYSQKKKIFSEIKDLTIITPSFWLQSKVQESFLSHHPIHVISNGVNLQIFQPRESEFRNLHNIENKKMIIGVANVWNERKGLNTFLLLSELIDKNTVIVLVGLNEKQISGLPKNIIGITRTRNAIELAEIYSQADVCANPSVEETFGMVTVEAMACGTPIVVFNSTASPELIDVKVGIVVEKGDVLGFESAIKEILEHGKEHYKLNCINRAKKYYDRNKNYIDYLDLYQRIFTEDHFFANERKFY